MNEFNGFNGLNGLNGLTGLMEEPKTQNHKEPLNEVKWNQTQIQIQMKWSQYICFQSKNGMRPAKSLNFE